MHPRRVFPDSTSRSSGVFAADPALIPVEVTVEAATDDHCFALCMPALVSALATKSFSWLVISAWSLAHGFLLFTGQ